MTCVVVVGSEVTAVVVFVAEGGGAVDAHFTLITQHQYRGSYRNPGATCVTSQYLT